MRTLNFIDLFAGAGGLSEGFIRVGYTPLAHIEMDKYACDTLKTRAAFHWLKANNQLQKYIKYLYKRQEKEDGSKLWEQVPEEVTFLNRFQVVDPCGCCHTVVAHIAMDGHYYIYPILNPTIDNVRSITIREAARLQSFPDDYYFEGSRSAA